MKIISKIILFLFSICLGVLFALYFSAPVGWMFVYIFVLASLISIIITFILKYGNKITLTYDVERTMLYKGEKAVLKIILKNDSILPVPAVKVSLIVSQALESEEKYESRVVSIPPRSETIIEMRYKAKIWGVCRTGVESTVLYDFMGFLNFRLDCEKAVCELKIFPNIPEIQYDSLLLRSIVDTAKFVDDSEETHESTVNSFAGMPGYVYREYMEGDPIRRINWKLSSKRYKYMVRLNDELETVHLNIVLDCCGGKDALINERAVEGVLGIALGLNKIGYYVTVYCCFEGVYQTFEISEPADVTKLQIKLADYRFSDEKSMDRIPLALISDKENLRAMLIYTPSSDVRLATAISETEKQGMNVVVVTSDNASEAKGISRIWQLNDDYSADLIS